MKCNSIAIDFVEPKIFKAFIDINFTLFIVSYIYAQGILAVCEDTV